MHAFISSRLDYCSSIFAGVSGQLLHKLQVVQNAAARLVTGARKCDCSGYGVSDIVVERSRVQLPAGALPGSLGQLSLPFLRDR